MSLIRSLNNPEGLYVWADAHDMHFMISGEDVLLIPLLHFKKLMAKIAEDDGELGDKVTAGNVISLEEVEYGKARLTYNGRYLDMWGVTWDYIYRSWCRGLGKSGV